MEIAVSLERAMIEEKLDSIDIEFTIESIKEQLDEIYDSSNKRNYLKMFNKKFKELNSDEELILAERDALYETIVDSVAERFRVEIQRDDMKLSKLAKNLYDFFVLDLIDVVSNFLEMYICENKKDIVAKLRKLPNINTKRIDELDEDMSLILNNLGEVVYIIYNSELDFYDFLEYADKHPDTPASVSEIMEYDPTVINDEANNLFLTIMSPLVEESDDFSSVFTSLRMNLYTNFVSN
jgi:hypothetical protein